MYKIYCNGTVIYDPASPLLKLIDPVLDTGVNKAGSLKFQVASFHPYYNSLIKRKSVIDVYLRGTWLWSGFVTEDTTGNDLVKSVTVEGILSFLNDSVQPYAEYHNLSVRDYFSTLIANHNKQVDSFKQFTVGTVTVEDSNDSLYRKSEFEKTKAAIADKLVNRLGGYLRVWYQGSTRYLDYIKDYDRINSQGIAFGKNLLSCIRNHKSGSTANAIIPLGARLSSEGQQTGPRVTIESVNSGKNYIYDEESVMEFGWIFDTAIFDDVTLPKNLIKRGHSELARRKYLSGNLKLTALDLHLLGAEHQDIRCGDYIQIKSKPHNLDEFLMVSDVKTCITAPDKSTVTIGSDYNTLTDSRRYADKTIENIKSDYVTNQKVTETVTEETKNNVIATIEQHYVSTSPTALSGGTWGQDSPEWVAGTYIWRRTMTLHKDGTADFSAPACTTGAAGPPGQDGSPGEDACRVEIISDNGNIFKNGEISTVLRALVYKGAEDITEELNAARFRWSRKSKDEAGDNLWNQQHFGGVKEITVTNEDVRVRATFSCTILEE